MNDSSKTSLVTVAGFAAAVVAIAVMANCSVRVAQTNERACVAKGGQWDAAGAFGNGLCEVKRP